MKRSAVIILITLCMVLLFQSTVFAQFGIRKGVKLGYTWSVLNGSGPIDPDYRKVLTGGLSLEFRLLGLLAFQVDALYAPRGATYLLSEDLNLTYLSVPIVLKVKLLPVGIHPFFLAGPEFNYLLSAKSGDSNVKDHVHTQDLCLVVGAGLEFTLFGKSVYIEGRYSYGLSNIVKEQFDGASELKHRVAQIYAGFLF